MPFSQSKQTASLPTHTTTLAILGSVLNYTVTISLTERNKHFLTSLLSLFPIQFPQHNFLFLPILLLFIN